MLLADAALRRLPQSAQRALVAVAVVSAVALVTGSFAVFFVQFPARFSDFRAFYCSGAAVRAGADPYLQHPLHECEHGVRAPMLSPLGDEITVPAPFPGIVLAAFAALSLVPFAWAALLASAGSVCALGLAIGLLARVTATPPAAAAIVLGFPALIVPLPLGQPTPLILTSIVGCGALLRANRPRLAALALGATIFDPHVALAAMLGVFAGVPRARGVLTALAVVFVGGSVLAAGPAREWEYVGTVVPVHALVNVPEFSQFSAANFAYMAGVPAAPALAVGNLWYLASLTLGTFVALRLRRSLGVCAIAFVPPAFAVFGGAHTHLQQLALAVPAFVLAAGAARGTTRAVLVAATFVAAAPWLIFAPFPVVFVAVALLAAAFAKSMNVAHIGAALGLGAFWLAAGLCVSIIVSLRPYVARPFVPAGNPLAEVAWGRFVSAHAAPPELWVVLGKLPTIAAFAVLLAVLVRSARMPAAEAAAAGA